ncbi:hypothetical protein N7466_009299 [Penicillium verhagenii]|uniref:uncharacterized protein n=1 Tax=Penicillium verhagenii TaxID=1562060 RepID=UPI002544FC91|nr:uncharacterized protein N7466_009299 [Penicillium verhagenii]KAJ5920973.1 hypothetical protein N7466_009299 [Penicillium verhagenii]
MAAKNAIPSEYHSAMVIKKIRFEKCRSRVVSESQLVVLRTLKHAGSSIKYQCGLRPMAEEVSHGPKMAPPSHRTYSEEGRVGNDHLANAGVRLLKYGGSVQPSSEWANNILMETMSREKGNHANGSYL